MPSLTQGFSTAEIVERVVKYVGNTSVDFENYINNSLSLAEFRFCKLHDWRFLRKVGLELPVTSGTAEYELSPSTIGFYMSAEDVESIFDETNGVYLKKVQLNQIRRLDPETDDGSATDSAALWAPIGDNKIRLWPPMFESGTLKIDGKITPPMITAVSNSIFPTIIPRYQESFIEYVIAMALDRENDDRAQLKKAEALALIRADIQDDLRGAANGSEDRIRHMNEARGDGASGTMNLDAALWAAFWND